MNKQTAVEWLIDNLKMVLPKDLFNDVVIQDLFKQAKEMDKQQSIYDYCEGFKASGEGWNGEYGLDNILDVAGEIDAEDYYNRTYKGSSNE